LRGDGQVRDWPASRDPKELVAAVFWREKSLDARVMIPACMRSSFRRPDEPPVRRGFGPEPVRRE